MWNFCYTNPSGNTWIHVSAWFRLRPLLRQDHILAHCSEPWSMATFTPHMLFGTKVQCKGRYDNTITQHWLLKENLTTKGQQISNVDSSSLWTNQTKNQVIHTKQSHNVFIQIAYVSPPQISVSSLMMPLSVLFCFCSLIPSSVHSSLLFNP